MDKITLTDIQGNDFDNQIQSQPKNFPFHSHFIVSLSS